MNILYLFGHELVIGGHFKSAKSFAKPLIAKGHNIYFLARIGSHNVLKNYVDEGLRFIEWPRLNESTFLINKIKFIPLIFDIDFISKTIKKYKIDIIHVHDSLGLVSAYYAATLKNIGFVFSQAGGFFKDTIPPSKGEFVVFSKELYINYLKFSFYNQFDIKVISERIDTSIYYPCKRTKTLLNKQKINPKGINIFIAIRLHNQKKPWLDSLLHFISIVEFNTPINLIIAGDGDIYRSFKEECSIIQNRKNNLIKFFFLGAIYSEDKLAEWYNFSDLVIGNGRGLLEAMACRKPVIILGENREFEIINEYNIQEIAYYNFSGRHFRHGVYNEEKSKILIEEVFNSLEKLTLIADFSYSFIVNKMSNNIGANKLEELYKNSLKKDKSIIYTLKWHIMRILKNKKNRNVKSTLDSTNKIS